MLRSRFFIVAALFGGLFTVAHPASATTPTPPVLFGTAGIPCETFSRQYEESRSESPEQGEKVMASYIAVLQGMLSEYNMRAFVEDRPDQVGTHWDNAAWLAHIDGFCQKNPDLQFAIGAQGLITFLRDGQKVVSGVQD